MLEIIKNCGGRRGRRRSPVKGSTPFPTLLLGDLYVNWIDDLLARLVVEGSNPSRSVLINDTHRESPPNKKRITYS